MIIEINTLSSVPIYEQLRDQIVLGIAAKKLALGEALPSVRRLAADLGINFHTVGKAYSILCEEGFVAMDRRKGAVVAAAISKDEASLSSLSHKLKLSAGEAICRGLSESEFITLCTRLYQVNRGLEGEAS